ncbi:RNA 2',3'-cyclic phosphodiesterase [Botryobacter ruber]|uniref:RNA 2',3'-cyclic phosphodiesterase n=1 Tax=Botryobacter ruber TaxID=2171629 RepID=UPI000E0A1241|nr:RNA 2',3'-cyclic phosphodiesterase [Botryobacter ruber]
MKDTLRLFVAAALPPALTEYLARESAQYQDTSVRLVPAQNLHLTLFFIGGTPLEALPELEEKIQQAVLPHAPFQLTLQCLEPGPRPRKPRLVWARFQESHPFEQLVRDLTLHLSPQPQQQKKAIPHITVARFRKGKPVPASLPTIQPPEEITFTVATVGLWKSELVAPHPVYSVLRDFPLGQNL